MVAGAALMILIGTTATPAPAHGAQAAIASCSGTGTTFAGGAGTTASPYQVATAAQLAGITGAYLSCAFTQTADISLAAYPTWTPIGSASGTPFTGSYDGQSRTVSDLTIANRASHGSGLFGYSDGASIANVIVSGVAIDQYVDASFRKNLNGALVGKATDTDIDNCHSSGSIEGYNDNGGLVGGLTDGSTITRSSSSANVSGNAWDAGGLVGYMNGTRPTSISSSWATGTVTSTGYFTGGLVGGTWDTPTITESYATGDVSYTGSRTAGYDQPGWAVGGLVGLAAADRATAGGTIARSFATGDVNGGSRGSGGLVGTIPDAKYEIRDSFATGDVYGDLTGDGSAVQVGGLVGGIDRANAAVITIADSYATGAVTANPAGGGGGLFGETYQSSSTPTITNSYWSQAYAPAVTSSPYGTQVTQAQMSSYALYAGAGWTITNGWAASGTWGICDGSGTPFLLWKHATDPCGAAPGSPAPDPAPQTPAPADAAPAAAVATGTAGGASQQAARPRIAWRVGRPAVRSVKVRATRGRTRLQVRERIHLSRSGRYTLIYVDRAGKRVPLAKGTRIASRKLKKAFYAPVMRVKGPDTLTISAKLARRNAKAITLRVILRNPDGTLEGENIPLR
jgi:hypothetical protein